MPSVHIGRRDLLRGLGVGAAFFAPFARQARSWAAGKPTPNVFVLHTPNGHVRSAFGGSGSGGGFTLKSSLAPLESVKAKVAIMGDLDNAGASSKGSHEDIVRQLTSVPGSDMYRGYGSSIDWVVANATQTRPMTMSSRVGSKPDWNTKLSWRQDGVFEPQVEDATAIYTGVFGNVMATPATPADPAIAQRMLAQGKSVLDLVRVDISTLMSRLAPPERTKLEVHLDSLRQLEGALKPVATVGTAGCDPAPVKAKIAAGEAGTAGQALQKSMEIKFDLAATAFACGVRRAATLLGQPASAGINPLGGIGHHNLSHGEGPVADWIKIDVWYAERFAYFVKKLIDMQLIDSTVVVWTTEISEQHNQRGFVIPVAGGGALGIQLGQAYAARDTLSNLWVSVQKAIGVSKDTFGAGSSGGMPGLLKPA
jgi:hypothetical protein